MQQVVSEAFKDQTVLTVAVSFIFFCHCFFFFCGQDSCKLSFTSKRNSPSPKYFFMVNAKNKQNFSQEICQKSLESCSTLECVLCICFSVFVFSFAFLELIVLGFNYSYLAVRPWRWDIEVELLPWLDLANFQLLT